MEIQNSLERLAYLCRVVPPWLSEMPATEFDYKPSPVKWSKKEIIGHLIDSATNNHHRIVRAQFEEAPLISYDQNQWNRCGYYDHMDGRDVIGFWAIYNSHLVHLIRRIPPYLLGRQCNTGGSEPVTLEELIVDYVRHMEHHLSQVGFSD